MLVADHVGQRDSRREKPRWQAPGGQTDPGSNPGFLALRSYVALGKSLYLSEPQ